MCSPAMPPDSFQSWRARCVNYLTHELQTPLTCILQAAADLSSEDFAGLGSEERRLLDSITRDSVQLSRTVTEVLAHLEAADGADADRGSEGSLFYNFSGTRRDTE